MCPDCKREHDAEINQWKQCLDRAIRMIEMLVRCVGGWSNVISNL